MEKRRMIFFALFLLALASIVSAGSYLAEDINQDGRINIADISSVSRNIGRSGCNMGNSWCERNDVNQDGAVDASDLDKVEKIFSNLDTNSNQAIVETQQNQIPENLVADNAGNNARKLNTWLYVLIVVILIVVVVVYLLRKSKG